MSGAIIVRIQSPDGNKRVSAPPSTNLYKFFQKIAEVVDIQAGNFEVYANRDKTCQLKPSSKATLKSAKIRHGDMLYLVPLMSDGAGSSGSGEPSTASSHTVHEVVEDGVDLFLAKQDGQVYRKRDEQLCHHGPNAKCVHCVPLEPYDERILKEHDPPIKHLSFHSHLRKLTGGVDKGKFAFLENISCKLKAGCTEHAPWPHGICTKCQPSAFTLDRQTYRHIDNIMFENPLMFDRFLDYWRKTGNQRIGFLYGKYEHHKDVPLGIKATVSAIYEPPQSSTANSLEFLEDPNAEVVDYIASKLGLRKVGWIFTDLVADDLTKGTVKHVRNMDAHFLSAEECIMAGELQNCHPNPCKLAKEGTFGSKFTTCIVTGDATNQIHTEAYQVSNQCMALVKDNCLLPTRDAPELGYVRESSSQQYVPDVFYSEVDSYGNKSKTLARPLPVEFLLIDVPCAFSKDSIYTFNDRPDVKHFPVENRAELGELQDLNALAEYMKQFPESKFLEAMLDFHLLVFLATMEMLPLRITENKGNDIYCVANTVSKSTNLDILFNYISFNCEDHMESLLDALKTGDMELATAWSKSEQWATIEHFLAAQAPSPTLGGASGFSTPGPVSSGPSWTCSHCTYINSGDRALCEICENSK